METENGIRETIEAHVLATPGCSTRAVARAVGVDDSTADYHLRRLRKEGVLRCHDGRRQVSWWHRASGPFCPVLLDAIPIFRREGVAETARALEEWPTTASELARRCGVPLGQVRWNVEVLGQLGLLAKTRTGRAGLAAGARVCVEMAAAGRWCDRWGKCPFSTGEAPEARVARPL